MRKVLIILILGAIIILSGCGATVIAVSGTVRGAQPNTVVAGATVTAVGESSFTTMTGADGSYRLLLPPGNYSVTATYQTFNKAAASINVEKEPVTKELTLSTGAGATLDLPDPLTFEISLYTQPAETGTRSRTAPALERQLAVLERLSTKSYNDAPEEYVYLLELYVDFPLPVPVAYQGIRLYVSRSAAGPFTLVSTDLVKLAVTVGICSMWGTYDDPLLFGADQTQSYYAIQFYAPEGETYLTEPLPLAPLEPLILGAPAHNATISGTGITLQWNEVPTGYGPNYEVIIYQHWGGDSWSGGIAHYNLAANQMTLPIVLGPGTYAWCVIARDDSDPTYRYSNSFPRIFIVE